MRVLPSNFTLRAIQNDVRIALLNTDNDLSTMGYIHSQAIRFAVSSRVLQLWVLQPIAPNERR